MKEGTTVISVWDKLEDWYGIVLETKKPAEVWQDDGETLLSVLWWRPDNTTFRSPEFIKSLKQIPFWEFALNVSRSRFGK